MGHIEGANLVVNAAGILRLNSMNEHFQENEENGG